jgi:hypothetical protein
MDGYRQACRAAYPNASNDFVEGYVRSILNGMGIHKSANQKVVDELVEEGVLNLIDARIWMPQEKWPEHVVAVYVPVD